MSEEEIKRIVNVEMLNTIKTELNSSMIFVYIEILEKENKQLKSILTELEETIKNKIKSFKADKDYFIDEKDMIELDTLIQVLKEKYK